MNWRNLKNTFSQDAKCQTVSHINVGLALINASKGSNKLRINTYSTIALRWLLLERMELAIGLSLCLSETLFTV